MAAKKKTVTDPQPEPVQRAPWTPSVREGHCSHGVPCDRDRIHVSLRDFAAIAAEQAKWAPDDKRTPVVLCAAHREEMASA